VRTVGAISYVAEQRALAHAGLAPQHQYPASAGEHVVQELVEQLTFSSTPEEPHAVIPHRAGARRTRILRPRSDEPTPPSEPAPRGTDQGDTRARCQEPTTKL
jgi:hypothetical protein